MVRKRHCGQVPGLPLDEIVLLTSACLLRCYSSKQAVDALSYSTRSLGDVLQSLPRNWRHGIRVLVPAVL